MSAIELLESHAVRLLVCGAAGPARRTRLDAGGLRDGDAQRVARLAPHRHPRLQGSSSPSFPSPPSYSLPSPSLGPLLPPASLCPHSTLALRALCPLPPAGPAPRAASCRMPIESASRNALSLSADRPRLETRTIGVSLSQTAVVCDRCHCHCHSHCHCHNVLKSRPFHTRIMPYFVAQLVNNSPIAIAFD